MNYREKRVSHNKFGLGTIVSQDEKYLIVQFDSGENKKFLYPSCFEHFITFLDEDINFEIKKAKEVSKKQFEQIQKENYKQRIVRNTKLSSTRTYSSVSSFCTSYKEEISKELSYLQKHKAKKFKIRDGKRLERGVQSVYSFEMIDELNIPTGVNVSLWNKQIEYQATVISCDDFTLLVSTPNNLGDEISAMDLSVQAWMLFTKLSERLEEIKEKPSQIVNDLICSGTENIDIDNRNIVTGQDKAINMSLNNPITFIWGPPGTGKTETLARIAMEHMKFNHRVLMVSYSNVSVDEAILRLNNKMDCKPGEIIRYGYAKKTDLKENEYLTVDNLTIHDHPDLHQKRKDLKKKLEHVSAKSSEYAQIRRELNKISVALQEEKNNSISNAKFVATTISMAIVNKKIHEKKYDVVIFDESSMAYIPQIVYAASLAKSHFICIGDFKQLPPIVQSGFSSKLNADIFDYCGISSAVKKGYNHNWLCMLDTQYRMHPDIANFVSSYFYDGLLKTGDRISDQEITAKIPMKDSVLSLVDLSNLSPICMRAEDKSHFNILSAFISCSIALFAEEKEIGIITPYRAQARLIHSMIRDYTIQNKSDHIPNITCATVHQFQGSEKDIIIFDVVDSYNMNKPGILLSSMENDYANRLFNVALTRSKEKFIAVGNVSYMKEKNLSNALLFRKYMNKLENTKDTYIKKIKKRKSNRINNNLFANINEDNPILSINRTLKENNYFEDLESAEKMIQIDIPGQINVEYSQIKKSIKRLFKIIENKKGIKIKIRVKDKSKIPFKYQRYIVENKNIKNQVTIIDKKIIWYGKPICLEQFHVEDDRLIPFGYPYIRFTGRNTATSIESLVNMADDIDHATELIKTENNHKLVTSFSTYILAKEKCSLCSSPMQLKKSSKGNYYLKCTNRKCNNLEYIEEDLVENYLYRKGMCNPKCKYCKSSLEPKLGKYGMHLICQGYEKHQFKLEDILF